MIHPLLAMLVVVVVTLVGCGLVLPKPQQAALSTPPAELTHCPGRTESARPPPRIRTPEDLAAYGKEAEALHIESERRRAVCADTLAELVEWIRAHAH